MALGFLVYVLLVRFLLWLASLTPDIPAALVSWIVFLLAMETAEVGRIESVSLHAIAIVALSLFDVTIKLSSFPILLIPAYLQWKARASFSFKWVAALIFQSSIIFLPWLAGNVVLTGYLIFPFAQFDVFRFDWKVPPELVRDVAAVITGWARIPGQEPHLVVSMPFDQWLPIWYRMLPQSDSILLIGILGGPVLLLILVVSNRQILSQIYFYRLSYAVSVIGVVFWFFQAPSPRFGYGFLVTLLLLLYTPVCILLLESRSFAGERLIPLVQSLLVVFTLAMIAHFRLSVWKRYLYSVKLYPQIETKSLRVDNQTLFLPVLDSRCWYDAFPCTPIVVPGLGMRGQNLEDGFHISQK